MEGVFPPQRSTHPFRIIEHDAISMHSMTSLGRVGRILGGSVDVSNPSTDKEINQSSAISSSSASNSAPTTMPTVDTTATAAMTNIGNAVVADESPLVERASLHDEAAQLCNDDAPTSTVTLQGKVTERPDEGRQHQLIAAAAAHLHQFNMHIHNTISISHITYQIYV